MVIPAPGVWVNHDDIVECTDFIVVKPVVIAKVKSAAITAMEYKVELTLHTAITACMGDIQITIPA